MLTTDFLGRPVPREETAKFSRRVAEAEVRGYGGDDHRLDATLVDVIGLHDDHQISPRFTTPPLEERRIA